MSTASSSVIHRLGAVALAAAICRAATGFAAPAPQTSIDDLIARNIAAKGGLARIQAITTIKQTGTLSMQGKPAPVTFYLKRPNMVRQETVVDGNRVVNAFDGTTAWIVNPFVGPRAMVLAGPQAESIREQSSFDGPLVNYKSQGYTISMEGMESAGDRLLIHLRLTSRSQQVSHVYLDANSFLEARIRSEADRLILDQEFSDYRDVEGVKVAFSLRTVVNGVTQSEMTLQTVEFNTPMADELFRVPKGS